MEGLIHYIFQHIDLAQVPTGFLEEYGAPLIPMETFNGTLTDSNLIDMDLWRTLYFQLQTGYCGSSSNPLDSITVVNDTIAQSIGDSLPIAVPLLIGQFNSVKSYAFSNNLLSYNSSQNQIYDVPGRSESPYQPNNLFAACPLKNATSTGGNTFVCKSGLVWNNTGKTISSIQIDFDNGDGFKTITLNTPVSVIYTDTGAVRWTIKVTLSDATVLQCYSQYQVLQASGAFRYADDEVNDIWPISQTGDYDGATVYISYTSKNRTNTMRKPLIVVEGYDVSSVAPDIQDNYSYTSFVDAIDAPKDVFDFNQHLDDIAGYDIVFIDFKNGTDDIKRNAKMVEYIIDMVNTAKADAGSSEQDVVMGMSMGGLVARYALAEMTKNSDDPETRLLITHDSPHRGANVPLGVQYLIEMAGNVHIFGWDVRDVYPQYDHAIKLLSQPATKQLLLYRATGTNTFVNNTFLDGDYRSMVTFNAGDPQPAYRFIATSLGSQCGQALFQPYHRLFYINEDIFLFHFPLLSYRLRTSINAYALPNTGSTNEIAQVSVKNKFKLFGFITIYKQIYSNTAYAPGTQLAVDGVAGATNPLIEVNVPHVNFGFPIPGILGIWGYAYAHISGDPTTFSFVPTASALDVDPFNSSALSAPFVDGVNDNFQSRSADYIAQESYPSGGQTEYNNAHIRFTARNSEWMYDEMENISNTLNCSTECSPSEDFTIQGDFPVGSCTGATTTFSVAAANGTATYDWSASPGFQITAGQGTTSITVQANTAGYCTISLSIDVNCGAINVPSKNTNHVGGYGSSDYPVSGPSTACSNQTLDFNTNVLPDATNYAWFWPQGWTYISGQGTPYLSVRTNHNSGAVGVGVANNCDAGGSPGMKYVQITCGYLVYKITPNPATNTLYITTNSQQSKPDNNNDTNSRKAKPNNETKNESGIKEISIFNINGVLVMKREFGNNISKAQINISNLTPGTYLVKITDKTHAETHQVIVGK